jgi:hypothetical protein
MDKTTDSRTVPQGSIVKRILRSIRRSEAVEELIQYSLYYRWVVKGRPSGVPSPHVQKRRQLKYFSEKYQLSTLVETGTYFGSMVEAMKRRFSRVYSIEFSEELYQKAKQRFADDANVTLLQGDSAVRLKEIVGELGVPALFWLDAHYSGGVTARADLDTPIVEEIRTILSSVHEHVLVIDDARCFDGTHDYPTVEHVCAQIRMLKPTYTAYVKHDAIIAEPTVGKR